MTGNDSRVRFTPTVLVVANDGVPHQVCRIEVDALEAPVDLDIRLRRSGLDLETRCRLTPDAPSHDLLVPEVSTQQTGAVEIAGPSLAWRGEIEFEPVRRWTVSFVNHSHTDIGFTHPPSEVADIHVKNLERALDSIEATSGWPDDARFRWTCESSWQVQRFLAAHPGQRDRLARAARDGLVEIEGFYIHSYFDLLSREQLVRSLMYAQWLRVELDVPVTSAMISDVPGCPWSLVDLLTGAGIRWLSMAPNNYMAPFLATTDLPRPFIWEGPAGGRIGVWYTGDPAWAYIEGARFGFWKGIDAVGERLPSHLRKLEREGYPFDRVQIQLGSDNRPLRLTPALIAREWNRRYVSPRIRMALPSEFFRHADANWTDRMPVVRGEWQSSWSQTTLGYPHEANLSRRNHGTLDRWERQAVLADLVSESFRYPHDAIDRAYDASLLFDEHSGPKGIWLPHDDAEARQSLREGYELFEQATGPARDGAAEALAVATRALGSGDVPEIVVWNLLGWNRSESVAVTMPDQAIAAVVEDDTGQPVAFERSPSDAGRATLRFRATDVPAFGFRRYLLASDASATPKESVAPATVNDEATGTTLENDRLAVTVDRWGRVTRISLAGSDANLVDAHADFAVNELARYRPAPHGPEAGGSFTADTRLFENVAIDGSVAPFESIEISERAAGSHFDRAYVRTETVLDGVYRWHSEVSLVEDHIELDNQLTWLRSPDAQELLYIALPFALRNPEIRHATQYTVVDPATQTLSGSTHDFFAVQHLTSLASEAAGGVMIHSSDLALADYGDINHLRFLQGVSPKRGHVMFRAAFGRGEHQNPGSPFGTGGAARFRLAIRPFAGHLDVMEAHRFGESQAMPLQAAWLRASNPGFWIQRANQFVRLDGSTAIITGLKRAQNGAGYIVRVWEACGRRALCRLSFPAHDLVEAWWTTPVEGDLGRAVIDDGAVRFELGPFETASLRFVPGR